MANARWLADEQHAPMRFIELTDAGRAPLPEQLGAIAYALIQLIGAQ